MNREEIIKDYRRFLQLLSMSGGINDVAIPKIIDKIDQMEEELNSQNLLKNGGAK